LAELYALTLEKERILKEMGFEYVSIWEHEFRQQLRDNPELSDHVALLDLQERLDPRESFFGGRTGATRLHYKADIEAGEIIQYVDFTSLYPWVNKYGRYPVGHPEIIVDGFDPTLQSYFGIAKVQILAPKGLYHPVLPLRSEDGRLKFPLCQKCALEEKQDPCQCTDQERAILGTFCTPEIMKALEQGYTLLKIYEVYHWPETTQYDPTTGEGGLFAEYVNTFLKFKQQASGWPTWCRTEEQKLRYLAEYCQKEGVNLTYEDIEKNPGLRSLAKLCLNR
jgi:hypothetical protein